MTQANSIPVEAEPDQERGARTPAPIARNAKGATIRRGSKVQPAHGNRTKAKARKRPPSSAAKVVAAVEDAPKPERPEDGRGLYPEGVKLFAYQPKGGDKPKIGPNETIYLPLEFERPSKVWLWELSIQPFLAQSWAWMNMAGAPRTVQRQCVSLPDGEYMEMFNKWFEAMGGGATPGE